MDLLHIITSLYCMCHPCIVQNGCKKSDDRRDRNKKVETGPVKQFLLCVCSAYRFYNRCNKLGYTVSCQEPVQTTFFHAFDNKYIDRLYDLSLAMVVL